MKEAEKGLMMQGGDDVVAALPAKRKREKEKSIEESKICSMSDKEKLFQGLVKGAGSSEYDDSLDTDDEQEPSDLVGVKKPCNFDGCDSSDTYFRGFTDTASCLMEYHCHNCGQFMHYDGSSKQILEGARRSFNRGNKKLRPWCKLDPTEQLAIP